MTKTRSQVNTKKECSKTIFASFLSPTKIFKKAEQKKCSKIEFFCP